MKMRGVVSKVLALSLAALATGCGFGSKEKEKELPPPPNGFLADTGFRPKTHGFAFKNSGGQYPKTPGIVDTNVVAKMFGKDACVGGQLVVVGGDRFRSIGAHALDNVVGQYAGLAA